jgi:alkanesulfonate monooxygenase SsuD/methylene tetrahydromethanopterin reductase-like flavin-dependent oxidoreductase (luciferase family)
VYELPLPGGEGRAIRSMAPPVEVPIYVASLGPANLRLTGSLADGWIGTGFVPEAADAFLDPIREGAKAAGRTLDDLDLTVQVTVELGDDAESLGRRHARGYAFTIGAMGSAGRNFYNDAFARQGFGDAVAEVQRLWLAGDREAAADRVPLELGLHTNLLGPPESIRERLVAYRDAGITTLRAVPVGDDAATRLDTLGVLLDLVAEVPPA